MLAETPTRLSHLLQKNKEWVQSQPKELFQKLASGQSPEVLWISCSDSRVCPNTMVGTGPGELFVSRNIANVVSSSDLSLLSVMTYAVDVLKVKHVVVLGHFGCGGVQAAMSDQSFGVIDNWLVPIKSVFHKHGDFLKKLGCEKKAFDKMVELNTVNSVLQVCQSSILQRAWTRHQQVQVHGWVYSIGTGEIKDLQVNAACNTDVEKILSII